ncbi:MAG TPA: Plug domain-containing protein, partial [Gammaproteobacteria bacterium]|nr:Plug domain-containing protein [Gammaproteobacteria bacterium]
MSTDTLLRQAVKGALALGSAGTMVGAGAALAQTAAPAAATATPLSNIVVTGSHIPRTSIATAQPIVTINQQQIAATGFTTTDQLLQNIVSTGASLNVQFNNGGNGSATINLHDLGAQRVLVLVNGQRWISSLGGTVDLTTIPLAAVDHVDVL